MADYRPLRDGEVVIPLDAQAAPGPALVPGGAFRPLDPAEQVNPLPPMQSAPPAPGPMSWGDWGRAALTAGVRGLGGLADAIPDPLAPLRRLVSPDLERIEQQGAVHPGQMAGNAVFNATGIPEYEPTTPLGRTGMSAAQGAVSGAPFGIGGALLGALGGGAGQATQEATGSERLATLAGLVPGGAAALAARRAVSRTTPELDAAGVNPTFGQAMGGTINRIEQGLGSIPIVGDVIRSGRRGAIEEYNRGYINRTLGNIGEKLKPDTPLGRPAIQEADNLIGKRYDAVTPQITNFTLDQQFGTGLTNIARNLSMYPQPVQTQFGHVVKTEILDRMNQPGGLTGQAFRDAESTLGQFARDNRNSSVANERALGRAAAELQAELRGQLRRSNPQIADELTNIHRAYSEMLPIDIAAAGLGTGQGGQSAQAGVGTPRQLTAGVRANDPTLRKRAFRQGEAVGQDYAEPGIALLGDNVPDSGSPFRALTALGAGGVAGAPFLDPGTLALAGGGALGAGMAYSAPGRAAMNYFLRRPEQAAATGLLGGPRYDEYGRPLLR